MKIIIPVALVTLLLWINASIYAQPSLAQDCRNIESCYVSSHLLLPQGKLKNYPQYASLPRRFQTGGERAFVFSPRLRAWAAYDRDGYLVARGKANGGSGYCSDLGRPCRTPVGTHRVYNKGTSSCTSSKFPVGTGGAPMPFCMFFRGGYAIHGSPYISNNNSSHGCIRVRTAAAQWLHRYFMRPGTKVVVLPY